MRHLAVLLAVSALWSGPVLAAEQGPLTIAVSKAQILHLSAPAQRVIVANPAIADVTVEKPTLITLFGKSAGETSLLVLGADDQEILNRPVVVTDSGANTVTVHAPGSQAGQAPVSRDYACAGGRCSKVDAGEPPAASAAPASPSR